MRLFRSKDFWALEMCMIETWHSMFWNKSRLNLMMVWDPGAYPNTRKNGHGSKLATAAHGAWTTVLPGCGKDPSSNRPQLTRAAAGPRRERGAPNDPRLRWIRRWWCPDPAVPQGPGPPGLLGGHWTHHLIDYSWVIQVGLDVARPQKNNAFGFFCVSQVQVPPHSWFLPGKIW